MTDDLSGYRGAYWLARSESLYYKYVDFVMRTVAVDAKTMIDVGTGNCPYQEWWPWLTERVSIDIRAPYSSPNVRAIKANILDYQFDKQFDICTCMQVLEHVDNPPPFAQRLFDLGEIVIITVPFMWKPGSKGHVQDPVSSEKLQSWVGRKPNHEMIVTEPFTSVSRLIAIYHPDEKMRWSIKGKRFLREVGDLVADDELRLAD